MPAHPVLEFAAFVTGSQIFLWQRRRLRQRGLPPPLPAETTAWLVVALLAGAALGAIGLAALEHLPDAQKPPGPAWFPAFGGKTIVGGILGGWIGIEIAKHLAGVRIATGDTFVVPLAAGIAIGRIGCFLTGLEDGTYGEATSLPWGVDFGDGQARHPTQLYESVFVLALVAVLLFRYRNRPRTGRMFREFVGGYLTFRLGIEEIKPVTAIGGGLTAIQWASLLGVIACVISWRRLDAGTTSPPNHG